MFWSNFEIISYFLLNGCNTVLCLVVKNIVRVSPASVVLNKTRWFLIFQFLCSWLCHYNSASNSCCTNLSLVILLCWCPHRQFSTQLNLLRAWSMSWDCLISFNMFGSLRWTVWFLGFGFCGSTEVVLGLFLDVAEVAFPCAKVNFFVLISCISNCPVVLF